MATNPWHPHGPRVGPWARLETQPGGVVAQLLRPLWGWMRQLGRAISMRFCAG